jgi:FkbM family methyltransferase
MEIQLRRHRDLFGPPKVIVVGAAEGIGPRYSLWVRKKLIQAAGFEADEQECKRLVARSRGVDYYPYALGNSDGKQILYITAFPGCSSCLEPNMEVLSAYPVKEWFKVANKIEISVHRFDSLYESGKVLLAPDFLHIDVQGFEFEVLEGMGKYINNVTCIEIESHLKYLYKGQKLFSELKVHLENKGFFLRDIETQGVFEGEVLELNAFFCKVADNSMDAERQSLIQLWEELCNMKRALFFRDCQWMAPHT